MDNQYAIVISLAWEEGQPLTCLPRVRRRLSRNTVGLGLSSHGAAYLVSGAQAVHRVSVADGLPSSRLPQAVRLMSVSHRDPPRRCPCKWWNGVPYRVGVLVRRT
jgi:hypothetical protein